MLTINVLIYAKHKFEKDFRFMLEIFIIFDSLFNICTFFRDKKIGDLICRVVK